MSYKLIKNVKTARRGEFTTVHGTVQTPAFMNVATTAAIKGGLSTKDLEDIRCHVMLCNTYHLHLRPTDKILLQNLEKSKKRGYTFLLTLMDVKSLWAQKKVCRFSPISHPQLQWPLTNV